MRRLAGIILFALGLVLVVCGIARILPGAASPGAYAIFIGLIVSASVLSSGKRAVRNAPAPLSPAESIAGIFYEPARVFQNLVIIRDGWRRLSSSRCSASAQESAASSTASLSRSASPRK